MRQLIILLLFTFSIAQVKGQLNVQLLHQLVGHSKDENERQTTARNRQAINTVNEELNSSKMTDLKAKYSILQSRFQTLSFALDATQIGLQAAPIISEIVSYQQTIIKLASHDPIRIQMAYQTEVDLLDKAYRLSQYLYALMLSIGDLNQMKKSDRKLLFEHVLIELRRIAATSRGLAANMYYANRQRMLESLNPFSEYINKDRQLLERIFAKIKQF